MANKRTHRGRLIDMDAVRAQHEHEIAAGNMQVNARGDKIGRRGEVIQKAEDRARAYYKDNPNAVKRVSVKEPFDSQQQLQADIESPEVKKAPEEIISTKKSTKTTKQKTVKDVGTPGAKKKEVILDDGTIVMVDEEQDLDGGLENE